MEKNQFRIADRAKKGSGLFGWMSGWLKEDSSLGAGFPVKYLPKVVFLVIMGLLYVGNTHYAERSIRQIDQLETEVEGLRADVTTMEAEVMYGSKQSEVAKKVKALGLVESKEPPYKIITEDGEY